MNRIVHGSMPTALGDLVHLDLERERRHRDAEAAHRARRLAVRVDAVGVDRDVRDGVRPGGVGGVLRERVRRLAAVGAGVRVARHLAGDDPAVRHDAVLDVDAPRAARRRDLHLLRAAVDEAHRPTGLHRRQGRDRLDDDVDLAAEPAADRAADEVEPVARDLQDDRGVVEAEVERLGVRVDGVPAVGLGHGDAAGGLDRGVLDRARVVDALDDVVGLARTPPRRRRAGPAGRDGPRT